MAILKADEQRVREVFKLFAESVEDKGYTNHELLSGLFAGIGFVLLQYIGEGGDKEDSIAFAEIVTVTLYNALMVTIEGEYGESRNGKN